MADRARLGTVGLLSTAAVFGLASEHVRYGLHDPKRWLPDLIVGMVFVGAGAYALGRQRGTGILLVAVGLSWWLANLADFAMYLHRGLLLHTIATYPGWRCRTPAGVALLSVGYVLACAPALAATDGGTALFGASVLAAAAYRLPGSRGPARRHRIVAIEAATMVFIGTAGAALARSLARSNAMAEPIQLVYGASLAAAAILLAAGLRTPSSAALADLVVELDESHSESLRETLARRLGDPLLQIGFRNSAGDYVDAEGRTFDLPADGSDRVATVVTREPGPPAVILHDRSLIADGRLLDAVASVARLSAANAALDDEARIRLSDLVASRRRLLNTGEEERRRLAARLRHGADSRLEAVAGLLSETLATIDEDHPAAGPVHKALDQLQVSREAISAISRGLHPLESGGDLASALSDLAVRAPIPVELAVNAPLMDGEVATTAYYVCSEALVNAVKHAAATKVHIEVDLRAGRVHIAVTDDGIGGADLTKGTGLRGLTDRVAAMGGSLVVDSSPGAGTRLMADVPTG